MMLLLYVRTPHFGLQRWTFCLLESLAAPDLHRTFFQLYILFSFYFSSPVPGTRCWVLASLEYMMFSYFFCSKIFFGTSSPQKGSKKGESFMLCYAMGSMQMRMQKRGGEDGGEMGGWMEIQTHTYIIC